MGGYRQCVVDAQSFEDEQPHLNENQQIVFDLLKILKEKWPSWSVSTTIEYLLNQQNEYHEMLNNLEEAQVLQAFASWVLEQEEERWIKK